MTPAKHPTRPGARVLLESPHGELRRGQPGGALLVIKNGAPGVIVGAAASGYVVVAFDDMGNTVGVSVPQHWLMSQR